LTYHLSNILIVYFLSSRRRHTTSKRDWSSDVCSSDLVQGVAVQGRLLDQRNEGKGRHCGRARLAQAGKEAQQRLGRRMKTREARSEERRVGKECRARRKAYEE